ncbi:MAG: hypothetical protein JWM63_4598 [Gammaproteobacteria bacterium]|jgi:hypothetical protein|nr:hypothetical protein [Gammaproteobacteria bacterium]
MKGARLRALARLQCTRVLLQRSFANLTAPAWVVAGAAVSVQARSFFAPVIREMR